MIRTGVHGEKRDLPQKDRNNWRPYVSLGTGRIGTTLGYTLSDNMTLIYAFAQTRVDPCNRIRNSAKFDCWNLESIMTESEIQI